MIFAYRSWKIQVMLHVIFHTTLVMFCFSVRPQVCPFTSFVYKYIIGSIQVWALHLRTCPNIRFAAKVDDAVSITMVDFFLQFQGNGCKGVLLRIHKQLPPRVLPVKKCKSHFSAKVLGILPNLLSMTVHVPVRKLLNNFWDDCLKYKV